MVAGVEDGVSQAIGGAGGIEDDLDPAGGEARFADGKELAVLLADREEIDARHFGIGLEEGADGIMGRESFAGHNGRLDERS